MAAIFLSKRTTIIISKASLLKQKPPYVCFSTAFERAETRGEGTGPDVRPEISSNDPASTQGMYGAKQQSLDMDESATAGATQFVSDSAKEGVRKATEIADTIGDTAKKTMDGAWNVSEEIYQKVKESVADNEIDGPVHTVEYRNYMERGIEELRRVGF